MRIKNYFLLVINVLLLFFGAKAQENNIALGQWRVHSAYFANTSIEQGNGKVYVSSQINAFSVDQSDNSVQVLSKANGLSDVSISKIRYNKSKDILLYGYANGNIDIFKNNTYTNISDIKRKEIVGSKNLNDIIFWKNYAYLCYDFGVCVFDLDKYEIKETYDNLAPSGLNNKIYSCAFTENGDSIFLATERGLLVARNHFSVNLMDFSNWHTYTAAEGISTTSVKSVICFNSKVYAVDNNNELLYLAGTTFVPSSLPSDGFRSFRIVNSKLIICTGFHVVICSSESNYQIISPISASAILDATIDDNGYVWALDYWLGLSTNKGGGGFYSIKPNGPLDNNVYNLSSYNNSILVTIGGYASNYNFKFNAPVYYIFDNYSWHNYDNTNSPIPKCQDLINGVYNPVDRKKYFSTFGYGMLVANEDNTYELINDTTGPFSRINPDPGNYVYVTYVTVDNSGNVWAANATSNSTDPSIHIKKTDGKWTSKTFGFDESRYPVEILIDDNDNKWIRMRTDQGGGIVVYDDKTDSYRYLTDQKGQGSLADRSVRAMAKDLNGDIWLATDKGISVFYNPKNIISSGESSQPIFGGFPLLYNESVTCIEVDGGNRKWIGTKNGVWLLNDDGTEVIQYFTADNSPLLSNYIVDIELNDLTGELFIGTDKGIISYRGDATAGNKNPKEIKVFPNPVKTGYNGIISISGLTKDSEVKITDIYGTLIYQTNSEGGTAVWRGRNYNGQFAAPGVYLIFAATSDGKESMIGKIAIE